MLKKIISVTLVLVSLFAFIPAPAVAVNINEDVGVFSPIFENMETTTTMAGINSQLTGAGSGVALSTDAAEGKFSWQVTTTTQTTNPYAQYTLVNSEQFNIAEFSSVKIWVKPGNGASWISFYTNNALITCDKDGDGQFEVGSDLTSGKWTQLTLDLLKTDISISTGDDLVVRSNDNSVWSFDEIKAQGTKSTNIDLSTMVNSNTTLNNGSLQFNKTSDGTAYTTTPTTLVSNRSASIERTFNKQTDFTGGTFNNCSVQADGSIIGGVSLCTGGTAISNGGSAASAFDSNMTSFWQAPQTGASLVGNAYIGYDFGSAKSVNGVRFYVGSHTQNNNPYPTTYYFNCVTSAHLQYYNGSSWVTATTVSINEGNNQYAWLPSSIIASRWRLLAASVNATGNNQYWLVYDFQIYQSDWSYTSGAIDISASNAMSQGILSYSASAGSVITAQTSLSLDGGATWQAWAAVKSDGTISGINKTTNLQNARIKYMLSASKPIDAGMPTVYSVNMLLTGNDSIITSLSGNLQGIKINNNLVDVNGNTAQTFSTAKVNSLQGKEICAFSGNGKIVYYKSGGNLYRLDVNTGVSDTISTVSAAFSVKTNFDGSVAAIYDGLNLRKYDSKQSPNLTYLVNNSNGTYSNIVYAINNNGGIIFGYTSSDGKVYAYYCSTNSVLTPITLGGSYTQYISMADNSEKYCYYYYSYIYNQPTGYITTAKIYFFNGTTSLGSYDATIANLFMNSTGDTAYFYDGSNNISSYNISTKIYRRYSITGSIQKLLSGDRLLIKDTNNKYIIYDPSTNSSTDVTPSDMGSTTGFFLVDNAGQTAIYQATDGIRISYLNASDRVCKYLLSFDGKNTWYSYSSGTWVKVSDQKTPNTTTLTKYGMTAEQVNALTANDFEPLYADGNEIYSVDVAVYFQSISPNYSPSINSIKIITDANSYGNTGGTTANPLYAVKKEDFPGSGWRKVNKIYPVEICNKASDYVYFIYVDNQYVTYSGTSWVDSNSASIADMIQNPGSNWAMLNYYGMTAEQVRAIPQSALTAELANKNFSVVYCVRVPDSSTAGYYSIINVDYTKNLYESDALTLIITHFDGRTQQIPGMTSEQIEDFMDWLLNRTKKSPQYFTLKVGNVNYYINYNTISDVSVTES